MEPSFDQFIQKHKEKIIELLLKGLGILLKTKLQRFINLVLRLDNDSFLG